MKMGYDATVYVIFGYRIPDNIVRGFAHKNVFDYEEDFESNHIDFYEQKLYTSLKKLIGTMESYYDYCCDNYYGTFITLKRYEFEVVRSHTTMAVEMAAPSEKEQEKFVNNLTELFREYDITPSCSMYMVMRGG